MTENIDKIATRQKAAATLMATSAVELRYKETRENGPSGTARRKKAATVKDIDSNHLAGKTNLKAKDIYKIYN